MVDVKEEPKGLYQFYKAQPFVTWFYELLDDSELALKLANHMIVINL